MPEKALQIHRQRTPEELAHAAATELHGLLQRRLAHAPFGIALSGGRIASLFYSALTQCLRPNPRNLTDVHFFWADERCIPPGDPENNFRVAREHLFEPLSVPAENIHRIRGEQERGYAVQEAEAELCRLMPLSSTGQPVLDVVILGIGEDGHIASLFPGESQELMASPSVYRPVRAVKPPPERITLGYAPIAAAREVWILASGAGKAAVLRDLQSPESNLPARRVVNSRAQTIVFEDVTSTLSPS